MAPKTDKKLVVATNMELTESEAKGFWPIHDQYQKDQQKINQRIANLLESYAADFRGKSLTDDETGTRGEWRRKVISKQ